MGIESILFCYLVTTKRITDNFVHLNSSFTSQGLPSMLFLFPGSFTPNHFNVDFFLTWILPARSFFSLPAWIFFSVYPQFLCKNIMFLNFFQGQVLNHSGCFHLNIFTSRTGPVLKITEHFLWKQHYRRMFTQTKKKMTKWQSAMSKLINDSFCLQKCNTL